MTYLCLQLLLIRALIIRYLRSTIDQVSIESAINKFGSPPIRSTIPTSTAPHVQRLSSSTVLAYPAHRMPRSSLYVSECSWCEIGNTDNPL